MVLFLLKDGTSVEVPHGTDVVRRGGNLVCLDRSGLSLLALEDRQVSAYTFNSGVARHLTDTSSPLAELDLPRAIRPGRGRHRRHSQSS